MKSYRYPPDLTVKHKTCKICAMDQDITSFSKNKCNKDGYHNQCKTCSNLKEKERYKKNPEPIKTRNKVYRENNQEKVRTQRRSSQNKKLKSDPKTKITRNLRNRLWYALRNKGWDKTTHFTEYIGCSYEELLLHLENQFSSEMTWNNQGLLWEIDHILPLSLSIDKEDMFNRCHFTNLKPMLIADNRRKSNKIANFHEYEIKSVTYTEYASLLNETHYLDHQPGAKFYFGLFNNQELVGTCSYGIPSMPNMATSFVDESVKHLALELKRFALKYNKPNEGSYFLSSTLKLLPSGHFIITYADPSQGHNGTLYKACNFIEMGITQKRRNYFIQGKENLHPRSLEKYTDEKTTYVDRVQKYRFLYITGNSRTKSNLMRYVKKEKAAEAALS